MYEVREKIGMNMDTIELYVLMAEGNPGALNIMMQIKEKEGIGGMLSILGLDDMNIRGTQIWIGYKDYCDQDLDKFIKCIKDRDMDMVECINKEGAQGNHKWKAVGSGSSFKLDRELL